MFSIRSGWNIVDPGVVDGRNNYVVLCGWAQLRKKASRSTRCIEFLKLLGLGVCRIGSEDLQMREAVSIAGVGAGAVSARPGDELAAYHRFALARARSGGNTRHLHNRGGLRF